MASEKTRVRSVEMGIKLRDPEIQEIILKSFALWAPEDVDEMRAWLKNLDRNTVVTFLDLTVDNIISCTMYSGRFICQIPIHEVIKKMIKLDVDDAEKDNISSAYLRGIVEGAECKVEFEKVHRTWKKTRRYTVKRLKDIADTMSKDRLNSNIFKAAGSMVSILGSIGVIGAATLLSGGVGIGAVAFGSVVSAIGGVTNIGASAVANKLEEGAKATANTILNDDAENTDNFIKLLEIYLEQTKHHMQTACRIDDVILRFKELEKDNVRVTIEIGDSVEEEVGYVQSATIGSMAVDLDGTKHTIIRIVTLEGHLISQIIGAAKTVGTLVDDVANAIRPLATGVVSISTIVVDIYNIVRVAMDISNGSPDEAADLIRKAAMDLENLVMPKYRDCILAAIVEAVQTSGIQIRGATEARVPPSVPPEKRKREERKKSEDREREGKKKRKEET